MPRAYGSITRLRNSNSTSTSGALQLTPANSLSRSAQVTTAKWRRAGEAGPGPGVATLAATRKRSDSAPSVERRRALPRGRARTSRRPAGGCRICRTTIDVAGDLIPLGIVFRVELHVGAQFRLHEDEVASAFKRDVDLGRSLDWLYIKAAPAPFFVFRCAHSLAAQHFIRARGGYRLPEPDNRAIARID